MYKVKPHKGHQPDYLLLGLIIILVIAGLVILSSASVVLSHENYNESYYYLKHQLFYSLPIGVLLMLACYFINYKWWQKLALPFLIISIILLILVFFPQLSYGYGGARRWLKIGSQSFQPSELLKISFVFYLAALFAKKREKVSSLAEGTMPFLVVLGIIALLLILQPDLSTLLIIGAIGVIVFTLAGAKFSHLAMIGSMAVAAVLLMIKLAPYRTQRLTVFLHPEIDPQGIGYQINQALLAIGAGGLFGRGLGHSVQKFLYLPEAIGDSIFAIAAEEIGLIGAGALVCLFVFLAIRGLLIAKEAPDDFGRLLAAGITSWIAVQAFMNMAAISGLIPLTGVPLPFVSYGGTSFIMLLASMGILLNISKHTI